MPSQDNHNNVDELVALNTQVINSATTTVGNIIDTAGFESVEFIIQEGVKTGGDVTVILQDGDDSGLSDAAVVAADFRLGSLATLNATNAISRVGYVGKKRYVRLSLLSANTPNLVVGGTVILGHPRQQPVAQ